MFRWIEGHPLLTCSVCGQSYGLTHSCAGPIAPGQAKTLEWVAPGKFSPGYYVRLALGIARLDDGAIRAGARDKNALPYGALIWFSANFFVLIAQITLAARTRPVNNWPILLVSLILIVLLLAFLALLQWLFGHLLARLSHQDSGEGDF